MSSDQIHVLIIDDEEAHAQAVAESLQRAGYACTVATSGTQGAERVEAESFDIVITDLVMADVDGMSILRKAKEELPEVEVIMISGQGTIKQAVAAMQQGAHTYLTKPLDIDELRTVVNKAAERLRLTRSNIELRRRIDERFGFEGVIGNSAAMHRIIATLQQIAPTSATVLIQGETGSGKELVAKAIHNNSPRKHKHFVAINCAAFAETLIESELFGHEKGAFTGADRPRQGKFEYANGGTLFLDEVGDMPMSTQIKLLRVLEEGEIVRIGSNEPIKVNVRLISATNQDLEEAVAKGKFRSELYYRLKVTTVRLPPLRERREDIPLLVDFFIKELTQTHGKPVRGIAPPARRALMTYHWPGNVRELRNVIESMVVVDADGLLDVNDLQETGLTVPGHEPAPPGDSNLAGKPLEEVERWCFERALQLTNGNREEAAKMLRIGERTMYRKIKQYGLS
jgi:two-component system response regulator HydG